MGLLEWPSSRQQIWVLYSVTCIRAGTSSHTNSLKQPGGMLHAFVCLDKYDVLSSRKSRFDAKWSCKGYSIWDPEGAEWKKMWGIHFKYKHVVGLGKNMYRPKIWYRGWPWQYLRKVIRSRSCHDIIWLYWARILTRRVCCRSANQCSGVFLEK